MASEEEFRKILKDDIIPKLRQLRDEADKILADQKEGGLNQEAQKRFLELIQKLESLSNRMKRASKLAER